MELIHVAHRQEAFSFFEQHPDLKQLEPPFNYVYQGSHFFLIISGEGIPEAIGKLAGFLGSFHSQIKQLTNLGVVGALNSKFIAQSIYSIRTCYAETGFKSFTLDPHGQDLVSADERVMTNQAREKLSPIASLVDRELWGVAQAAHLFKIPVRSFKIISDQAGASTDCLLVRTSAEDYSNKLYQYWQERPISSMIQNSTGAADDWNGFHFTKTHRHYLDKLLKQLSIKENVSCQQIINSLPISKIKEEVPLQKNRSKHLIELLELRLAPQLGEFKNKFNQLTLPLRRLNISVHHDQQMESESLDFHFKIKNENELHQTLLALNEFKWEDWNRMINGIF